MSRSAARRAMTAPSPGRSRMVMRSVALMLSVVVSYAGPCVLPSSPTNARIAINASLDSDMPTAWARFVQRAFSTAEARAVIDTSVVRVARQLISIVFWALAQAKPSIVCALGAPASKHEALRKKVKRGLGGFLGRNFRFFLSRSTLNHTVTHLSTRARPHPAAGGGQRVVRPWLRRWEPTD